MKKDHHNLLVIGHSIAVTQIYSTDFISITDIAKYKNPDAPADIIKNWLRTKNTIELLGLWEKLNNDAFKLVEFDQFRNDAGFNHFVMSPKKWVESTNAIGIKTKSGRYGGTIAHIDLALEFASWISVEFKLYMIKEFQRLKSESAKDLDWDVKRNLAKINYKIHTGAIQQHLIPQALNKPEINNIYATEADILNMALFGRTAAAWRKQNPEKDGNIRDYANVTQLVCLANLESLNSVLIADGLSPSERLYKLNVIAISQMKVLLNNQPLNKLKNE